jgi:hypothetical protein
MIKTILEAGQIIDLITIDDTQYFCVIHNPKLNVFPIEREVYNNENQEIKNMTIERFTINSTMIVLYDGSECLTDNFANFFEKIKYAIILTENNFKSLI